MPHVVVGSPRPLADLVREWQPVKARLGDTIVRIEQAYIERGGGSALLPAMTIKGPLRQHFLILAAEKPGAVTVRLHELTDPEKTHPVHLALALVARFLRTRSPSATPGPTNIPDAVAEVDAQPD